ncbi:hypothetical protein GCM10022268_34150 [Sphingomonas cynarae]|uniref:Uncharacterized protein n=1 Tax=Sphingomonas cynarae TaxID=930197 RepID=A0ABP7ET31_9SPHN
MPANRLMSLLAVPIAIGLAPATALANGGGGGGGAAGGVDLIPMAQLDVPIVEGNRSSARLRLKLVLRASDPVAAAKITAEMPALREAALAGASEFARLYASPFVPVDAEKLAHDMTAALHGRDSTITAVLLVNVVASPA